MPPIPCHVHAGDVVDGCCMGHGKTEAYFFPPLDVPPYNMELGPVKTRLGLRPDVTKDKVGQWLHVYSVGGLGARLSNFKTMVSTFCIWL